MFRTLREGQPFVAANATRIRRIGYGGDRRPRLRPGGGGLLRHALRDDALLVQGLQFEARPTSRSSAIVGGLIILVIAEVFGKARASTKNSR